MASGPPMSATASGMESWYFSLRIAERDQQRRVRWPRQLSATTVPALAPVSVERSLALDRDVARSEVDHLAPAPTREHQCQDDRAVAASGYCVRDDREDLLHVRCRVAPCRARLYLRALQCVAGVGGEYAHSDQEVVEAAQARHPGTTRAASRHAGAAFVSSR